MDINNAFGLKKNDVISVVGAGGKTSLIEFLASNLAGKILLSASTKMYKPKAYPYINKISEVNNNGIYVSSKDILNNKKLAGLNPFLPFESFDYHLIESDGSNQMPIKGWRENEPVIIDQTTVTIGVVDITTIGKELNDQTVFRRNEFETLVGKHKHIEENDLLQIINNSKGLFKQSKGQRILFINKVESKANEKTAIELAQQVTDNNTQKIERIIIGSIKENNISVIYSRDVTAILASGQSRRMGENKLLMPFKGYQLIEHVLKKDYKRSYKLVIGKDEEIKELASKYDFRYVNNCNFEKGQCESLKTALNFVMAKWYMFVLGDQPFVESPTIESLFLQRGRSQKGIIACTYNDIICTPVVFNQKYKSELLTLCGDQGGKTVIKAHKDDLVTYKIKQEEYIDIDTKEDKNKWCKK